MQSTSDIKNSIREFLQSEVLGSSGAELADDTPLISGGLMNSLSSLQLVSFLEDKFDVELAAHEISVDYLDTVERIAETVEEKQKS